MAGDRRGICDAVGTQIARGSAGSVLAAGSSDRIFRSFARTEKIHCPKAKLVFYVLFFPWFDLVDVPLSIASLFMHVTWRKIEHDDTTKVEDIVGEIPAAGIPAPVRESLSEERTDDTNKGNMR